MEFGKACDQLTSFQGPILDQQPLLPRLFILSDVRLMCEGLALTLSHQPSVIVLGSSDLTASPAQIAELLPDVLLLDIAVPGSLDAMFPIRQILPDLKIVAFAVADIDREVIACAEAGLSGYVSRDGSAEDLVAAVHRAVRGELLCSPRTAAQLFSRVAALSAHQPTGSTGDHMLTWREREIVALLGEGLSNKEIARRLRIGIATVKNHVHSVLNKLQLRRRGEAGAWIRRTSGRAASVQLRQSESGPAPARDRPVERQRENKDEPIEPIGAWLASRLNPRVLKSENMASMPQRRP